MSKKLRTDYSYKPRLSIEISEEQSAALSRLIPWGLKGTLFQVIIDDIIELIEKEGEIVIAAIIKKKLHIDNFPSLKKE